MGAASERDDHRSVTDIAGRVDGLALMPSGYNDTLPLSMLAKTIPLVMVGVGDEKLPAAYLQCDNASGMRQIVDHLVEVHHINDMAFVGGVNGGACARGTDADDVVSRYDAFKNASRNVVSIPATRCWMTPSPRPMNTWWVCARR